MLKDWQHGPPIECWLWKYYTDLIIFHETTVDQRLVMIKDFVKVSNLRKVDSIFILWTIIVMSHHMIILGTSTTNCLIKSDSNKISKKQNVFPWSWDWVEQK